MSVAQRGIHHRSIHETPIAIIDFETTGLTPGVDRVVEVSIVRIDPGQPPSLVFDTLVNPRRRVSATEIHGITDDDVADAPTFEQIAHELLMALSGCVVAAYNVYFDAKFLAYELKCAGVDQTPPHFCLMYMRPLLELGSRCRLEEACLSYGIDHHSTHMASSDATASAQLLLRYLEIMRNRKIATFGELCRLRKYKFFQSFAEDPFTDRDRSQRSASARLKSRSREAIVESDVILDPTSNAIKVYWDSLRTVLADLAISDDELADMLRLRAELKLSDDHLRLLHARAFASVIVQFCGDQRLDVREARKLKRLHACLRQLGWAPGE